MILKMQNKIKANKKNIFNTCETLYSEDIPIDEITHKLVTDRLGAKGNSAKTFSFIKEWKETKQTDLDAPKIENDTEITAYVNQVVTNLSKKNQEQLKTQREVSRKKILELESNLEEIRDENEDLQAFKDTFNSVFLKETERNVLLEAKIETQDTTINEQIEQISKSQATSETHISNNKALQKVIEESHQKYISFTQEFQKVRDEDKNVFEGKMQTASNEKRIVELRLISTEEKYTDTISNNARLQESLSNTENKLSEMQISSKNQGVSIDNLTSKYNHLESSAKVALNTQRELTTNEHNNYTEALKQIAVLTNKLENAEIENKTLSASNKEKDELLSKLTDSITEKLSSLITHSSKSK